MKLVELLAREMSEWPEKASHAVQHEDGDVGFTYDGKPGRDKDHSDWSINALTASEKAYWLIGVAKSISTIASDHATAIVTRADWEAERARIAKPAKKADKDGWIRHRGGKCPVDGEIKVEARQRGGQIVIGNAQEFWWEHRSNGGDIMAYRLHKPAEQVAPFIEAVNAFNALAKVPQLDGPLLWRDRIAEIDATNLALTTERAELVQKLASEGFALIGRINDLLTDAAQKHEAQQPVPGKWEVGDSVECISSNYSFITVGTVYVITGFDRNMVQFLDDDGTEMEYERAHFKFHSRPSA